MPKCERIKDLSFIIDIIFRLIEEGNSRKLKSILTLTGLYVK